MLSGNTLQLTIHQQYAKIGLDISRPKQEIQQPKADVQITQRAAKLEINAGSGQLNIDSSEARSALGHKPMQRMIEDMASQARQMVLEAIGEIASEGDQLMKIEKGTTIPQIALNRWDNPPSGFEHTGPFEFAPVDISYTPHPVELNWTLGGAEINITPRAPIHQYTPGKVEVYLAQKNGLQIDVRGQYMNRQF